MTVFHRRISRARLCAWGLACLISCGAMAALPAAVAVAAPAQQPSLPKLAASDMKTVAAAEAYLNSVTTLQARFVQTGADGKQLQGDFMLQRPGRMRFQYDAPVTDFIVADGQFIYYYDGALKQQSNTLITHSLANFFLRKNLSMSGDIAPVKVERRGGMVYITLVQTKHPHAGTLTIVMSQKPMTLQGWRVTDATGAVTDIALQAQMTGIALNPDLFHYYDPNRAKVHYNK